MSRFVRASKYRHVYGQGAKKKELCYENVKVTNSAWDTNVVAASGTYISINWNASGGGAFAILPLPSPFQPNTSVPYKLPDTLPLARSHTAPVLDTDWSPHNDAIVASAGEDGKVCIWKVEAATFDGWSDDGWVPPADFDPVSRIDASPKKIGQVLFHPTAANVLASASSDHVVKLWDLANPEDPRTVLTGHGDTIQSIAFNLSGTLLATTCRDRKLRIFDTRAGGEAVRIADGHGGVKGCRVVWMGEMDRIATTGFSKMSDRQVGVWEAGSLQSVKMITLDQSAGVVMPFWSDNNILFLGEADGNIRYYEYESDNLYALDEFKSSEPQRGMCFLPRRALNISECEIARAYKLHGSCIEPIPFIVPRKADSFQADIYPPALSDEPSLTAAEFFNGKVAPPNLVSLGDGRTFASSVAAPPMTRTVSAPAPAPAAVPQPAATAKAVSEQPQPAPTVAAAASEPIPVPASRTHAQSFSRQIETRLRDECDQLKTENSELTAEVRTLRAKIRDMEVQVEAYRANARKAAALLDV
ncbi:DUF1900-domain-containing protein [Fistulina hepatica ATCC 64428]|uniref:Coronin n=1 Tax=Fistulina hepatica ATCC 64428 TaxID=1128425 RepID=A0A0D7A7R4_9AGAR|nr:DUF1900-domain-containing protein [Fistulina hepatica ATCC 64428]